LTLTALSHPDDLTIRAFVDDDFDEVVARWHETNLASYRYNDVQQSHTLADARNFFRTKVLSACDVLVATRADRLLGMLAMEAPWIRHFAVFPEYQRQGFGSALLRRAQERSPRELRLFTFQRNDKGRAFYQKHGFTAIAFGVSPAPELEPDVEYRWIA